MSGGIDWDQRIPLTEAAAIAGLSVGTLRNAAIRGDLVTEKVGARLHVTTRRWLDAYLGARGGSRGRQPKPPPAGYQAPPRRGRPPKTRHSADDAGPP